MVKFVPRDTCFGAHNLFEVLGTVTADDRGLNFCLTIMDSATGTRRAVEHRLPAELMAAGMPVDAVLEAIGREVSKYSANGATGFVNGM